MIRTGLLVAVEELGHQRQKLNGALLRLFGEHGRTNPSLIPLLDDLQALLVRFQEGEQLLKTKAERAAEKAA